MDQLAEEPDCYRLWLKIGLLLKSIVTELAVLTGITKNTPPNNELTPESLNTLQTFHHERITCVSGWIFILQKYRNIK